MGPVDLLVLSEGSFGEVHKKELYDRFGAAAMKDIGSQKTLVAVAPGWRKDLGDSLASDGIRAEEVVSGRSLVSLVGTLEFIAHSFSRVESMLAELGIKDSFRERAEIRSTFATPYENTFRLVEALYGEFVK